MTACLLGRDQLSIHDILLNANREIKERRCLYGNALGDSCCRLRGWRKVVDVLVAKVEVRMHDVIGIYLHVGTNSVSYSTSTTYVCREAQAKCTIPWQITIMTHLTNFHLVCMQHVRAHVLVRKPSVSHTWLRSCTC